MIHCQYGQGNFRETFKDIRNKGEKLPDSRQNGWNYRYKLSDVLKYAFGVFFFQYPSLLDFQRKMKEQRRRNNMETVFGINEIPSDTQIRNVLDGIKPE